MKLYSLDIRRLTRRIERPGLNIAKWRSQAGRLTEVQEATLNRPLRTLLQTASPPEFTLRTSKHESYYGHCLLARLGSTEPGAQTESDLLCHTTSLLSANYTLNIVFLLASSWMSTFRNHIPPPSSGWGC